MQTIKEAQENNILLNKAYGDYCSILGSFAYSKLQNRETSNDLVQESFMKTWAYLVKGGKIEIMKAFLFHILKHLIVDEYRKHKSASLDVLFEKGFEVGVDDTERLFNMIDGKHALVLMNQLSKKYQRVLRMRYVQLLTLSEMSVLLGETKNSVAVQLHRGMQKLQFLYSTQ